MGFPLLPTILVFLSILSPEIFRVVFPPEIIEIAKRLALLPKDIARIINGLLHLPLDTMRAIAVLDDPAEVENETVNVTVEDGETGVIPYGAELEAENGDAIAKQPEEPVPEPLPEEPVTPLEPPEVYGPPKSLMTPREPPEEPITPQPEIEVSTAQEEYPWYQPVTQPVIDFFEGVWQGITGWWGTIFGESEYPEYEPGHEEEYRKEYTEAVQKKAEELGNPARTAGEAVGGKLDPLGPISPAKEAQDIVSGYITGVEDVEWVILAKEDLKANRTPSLVWSTPEKIVNYVKYAPDDDPLKQWFIQDPMGRSKLEESIIRIGWSRERGK